MVVTPFGEFELNDLVGERYWLDAHKRRHSQQVQVTGLPGGSLDGPIDGDWFFRHWARHVALATFQGVLLGSADTKALALPMYWQNDQQLYDWHDLHNRIHLLQDRQLNL